MTDFSEKVYEVVSRIPKGRVMTYKEVALAAGNPKAARAVGNTLNRNPHPGAGKGKVPCHRVIRSDGKVGGYAFGVRRKKKLLKKEAYLPD